MNNIEQIKQSPELQLAPKTQEVKGELSGREVTVQEKKSSGLKTIQENLEFYIAATVLLQKAAKKAVYKGVDLTCGLAAVIKGLGLTFSGGLTAGFTLPTGLAITGAGVYKIYEALSSKNPEELQSILQDASANIQMFQALGEMNEATLKTASKGLEIIKQDVSELNQRLDTVKSIATQGEKETKKFKKESRELYKKSQKIFEKSQQQFLLSQKSMEKSQILFSKAMKSFSELIELGKQKGDWKGKTDQFVKLSKQAYNLFLNAQKELQTAQKALQDGLDTQSEANAIREKAAFAMGKAMTLAEEKFKQIQEKAKSNPTVIAKIEAVQENVKEALDRNNDQMQIAKEAQDKVDEALAIDATKFGMMSMIFGVAAGFGAGATGFGALTAIPTGIGVAKAMHHRNQIARGVEVIVGGYEAPNDCQAPGQAQPVTFAFDKKSSGWYGRYWQKRSSQTVGNIQIDLGFKAFNFRFDLNQKRALRDVDTFALQKALLEGLKNGKISTAKAREVMNFLETTTIDRGSRHVARVGFLPSQNNPYFGEIKRICDKMDKAEKLRIEEEKRIQQLIQSQQDIEEETSFLEESVIIPVFA
jgi:hypothetical protein